MRFSRCSRFIGLSSATLLPGVALLALLAGCSAVSSTKPSEILDERTGMTVEELHKPLELTQTANNLPAKGKHISFAYLGPVEWDRSGTPSYGLWVHIASGNDWQFDPIRQPGTVTLVLDDGAVPLHVIDAPQMGHATYRPVAPWGQTAYFDADIPLLKRMAASGSIRLDVKAGRDEPVHFAASPAARAALAKYVAAQGY
jgi:hypothetical protein